MVLPVDVTAIAVIPVLDILADIQKVNTPEVEGVVDNQVVPESVEITSPSSATAAAIVPVWEILTLNTAVENTDDCVHVDPELVET
jgi:hypothetical protein